MRSPARVRSALFCALALLATIPGATTAVEPSAPTPRDGGRAWQERSTDAVRLVVTLAPGIDRARSMRLERAATPLVEFDRSRNRAILATTEGRVRAEVARLEADPAVTAVQVSRRLFLDAEPEQEALWPHLWALDNRGQSILGSAGVANVDMDGREALHVQTGSGVVVAVIDDGVDFSRSDLSGQQWVNPGESGGGKETNGVDDDANGYIDDVNGWDFCHDDKTVHDPNLDYHGTHVAGTIAAKVNGSGIVGVAPGVKLMALKFISDVEDCGYDYQAIEAIEYAQSFGVKVSNNSWGRWASPFPEDDQPLYDAIAGSGMLFVASAGNSAADNDMLLQPAIPSSFDLPNVLSVAALTNRGELATFSNYGATTVDVAAPGEAILSVLPAYNGFAGIWPAGWYWLDGTSMAAPHVSGIAALVGAAEPAMLGTPTAVKARILDTAKPAPDTAGLTLTGGVASAANALDEAPPTAFAPNTYAFIPGRAIGSAVSARVRWPAGADDVSGIGSYAVRQSVDGAAWTTVTASTPSAYVDRPLTFGRQYQYRVRAHDRAGNSSAYVDGPLIRAALVQQTAGGITYGGSWATASSSSASGGSTRYATAAGAWVQYTFSGRGVGVIAPKGPTRGSVKVYIDGTYVRTVSAYRSTGQSRIVLTAKDWSSVGSHRIKLVLVGTAGHARFDLDGFVTLR